MTGGNTAPMRHRHTPELIVVILVLVTSVIGFSSLWRDASEGITRYQALHIVTSMAWLLLLLGQLILVRQRRFDRHRVIGQSIAVVGPVLIASVSLLTVHSAARAITSGEPDALVVQNVTFTLELALLVVLAFVLRRNRAIHGALLMSTALMFFVIALFFTLISYVPGYRIEGPETFGRFATSAQASALVGSVIGLGFFLRNLRTGWPWLLAAALFQLNGYLQMVLAEGGHTQSLTARVAAIGEGVGFGVPLGVSAAMLGMALRGVRGRGPRPVAS